MELIIKGSAKEIADLVVALQGQLSQKKSETIQSMRLATKQVFSKFCDDFNMHDEKIDAALEKLSKE